MTHTRGVHEENKRSVLKAISWRVIATTTGMSIVYISTGRLELTAFFAVADIILKMLFYFMHERVWNKISFGRTLSFKSAMRAPPITVAPSETIPMVIEKMVASNIGAVIVVDDGKPAGLITEKDILRRELDFNYDFSQTCARDFMSSPVVTVEDNRSSKDMLQIMHKKNIRRLAVTHNEKLVGIVTERRILSSLL